MKLDALWKHGIKLYNTYDEVKATPAVHLEHYVEQNEITEAKDVEYLRELVDGMMRYKKLIECTVSCFMKAHKEAAPSDKTNYLMLSYIALIRVMDLNTPDLIKVFKSSSISATRLKVFLSFLLEESSQEEFLIPDWQMQYEISWIKNNILPALATKREELLSFLTEYEGTTYEASAERPKKKTIPEPFNLTKPKPKPVPQPEPIAVTFKCEEPPATTYKAEPHVVNSINAFKQGKLVSTLDPKIAEQIKQNVSQPEKIPFTRVKAAAETNNEKKEQRKKIKEEKIKATLPDKPKKEKTGDEWKKIVDTPAVIKLNTAAILREDALYKKKQTEEAELLKKYETELRDASQFQNWQGDMKAKDEEERKLLIEKRKIEAMLTDERARKAKMLQEKENQQLVREFKKQAEEELDKVKRQAEKIQVLKKKKAEEIQEKNKIGVEKAKEKVKETKEEQAGRLRNERKELEMRIAEQLELERQRKEELILQIKALELVQAEQLPAFDPTERAGVGLLNEMSYTELQERLKDLREKQKTIEEEKRRDIIASKKKKEDEIVEKAQKIAQFRQQSKKENAKRKLQKLQERKAEDEKKKSERAMKLLDLHSKLNEERDKRRTEQRARQEEAKQHQIQSMLVGADKAAQEEKHFAEQEKGAEREAAARSALIN